MYWLIALTPLCFFIFKWLQAHYLKHSLFNPILISIAFICGVLVWFNIDYQDFSQANQVFFGLLDLAIVSLAIPLYKESRTIKKDTWRYLLCSCIGVTVSASSAMLIAFTLGANTELIASLAPNAVTTPIAIEVSEQINGISALSAVVVICVGIFGAICGLPFLKAIGIKQTRAQGLALGAACHAVGTARAIEVNESMGAFASVSLVLSAILTPLLVPLIYTFLAPFFTT